jgi:general secretion pathway protein H
MKQFRRDRGGRAGFTLIELLVVLVIIGLLVGLGPIAFNKVVPGIALKSSAREVLAAFHEARGIAIRDNREAVVIIDVDARTYRLGDRAPARELDSGLKLELVAAESERIDESQGRIRFYPDGTSTGGRLTLTRNERKYDVVVDWITGRAKLQE